MEELITEVDKDDKFLCLRPRNDFYQNHKLIHRSANLLLFNVNNELLLQKRSENSNWFPGLYDFSASGTVGDESYEECMAREIKEELGLKINFNEAFKYFHESEVGRTFKMVFISTNTGDIKANVLEVDSVRWINLLDLQNEINQYPEKFTPQFIEGIKRYIKFKGDKK